MSYGAQIKFGLARQTASGSGNAVTAVGSFHHLPLVSEDVGLEKEEVISQNLTGRFEQGAVYDGVARINGTIEFEPTPKALGAVLAAVVRPVTLTQVHSFVSAYRYIPRTADFSSLLVNDPFTIYKQFADASSAEQYFDCQLGQVELAFAQGQLLRARANVIGGTRNATGVGSAGITLDTTDLSLGWLWDTTSISYNGAAVGAMSEVTVTLNENIEGLYTLNGTLAPYKYGRSAFREVTVNGTLYYTDRSILNDFATGTQRRLVITSRNTRSAIQSGYYPTLEIDVPQMKVTAFKPGASGPGEVAVSFTGRGVLDTTSNYGLQVTLTSTYTAGY